MTKILGLSGKKQCGKTTTCNFLFGMEMCSLSLVDWAKIDEKGRLEVPVRVNEELTTGYMDPCDPRPEVQNFFAQTIWPHMKVYQLADPLKQLCVEILGLSNEQCNGTNAQKETLTQLRWEDMPGITTELAFEHLNEELETDISKWDEWIATHLGLQIHKTGFMTGREVMQHVGTDMFRRMYPDVWVDAVLRRIQKESPTLAIVSDVRFPNEVKGIQVAGGKVIRFTRDPFKGEDQHESETALDDYPVENYDALLENDDIGIPGHNELVYETLKEWGYLDHIETDALDRMGAPE